MLDKKFYGRLSIISLMVLALVLTMATVAGAEYVPVEDRGYASPESLISCEELNDRLGQDDLVVVDNRHKAKFHTGHIPGAVNIATGELQVEGGMRLSKEGFEQLFSEYGIEKGDTVVIYDDRGDLFSAYLWWTARVYGHEDVRLLDGGIGRWKDLGYDTKLLGSGAGSSSYQAEPADESLISEMEEVRDSLEDEDVVILDTRSKEEYEGEKQMDGAGRSGRIPNSVWIEWTQALNEDNTFKTAEELEAIYTDKGVTAEKKVITYCQSAVRGSHSLFVLSELLGYEDVANYDGSWIEWSNNEDLPIE